MRHGGQPPKPYARFFFFLFLIASALEMEEEMKCEIQIKRTQPISVLFSSTAKKIRNEDNLFHFECFVLSFRANKWLHPEVCILHVFDEIK